MSPRPEIKGGITFNPGACLGMIAESEGRFACQHFSAVKQRMVAKQWGKAISRLSKPTHSLSDHGDLRRAWPHVERHQLSFGRRKERACVMP